MNASAPSVPAAARFRVSQRSGEASALLLRPRDARCLFVMAHGAGAGMRHAFMDAAAARLAEHGVATFRYQFPYSERGGGNLDPQPVLLETVRSAVAAAREQVADLPLLAGGKSMGGRMTSLAAAEAPLPGAQGLVFVGFPLHPAGRPGIERARHLIRVTVPMLFLQGTRDALADLTLLRPVCDCLGARTTLHVVEGADHSFHVLKRTGRTNEAVLLELAWTTASWASELPAGS